MSAGEGPVQTDGQPAPRTPSRTQEEVQRTHCKIIVWLVSQTVCPGLLAALPHVSLLLYFCALPDRTEILLCLLRNANKYVDFKPHRFLNDICEDEMLFSAFADSADVLSRWI